MVTCFSRRRLTKRYICVLVFFTFIVIINIIWRYDTIKKSPDAVVYPRIKGKFSEGNTTKRFTENVNCASIIKGDKSGTDAAIKYMNTHERLHFSDDDVLTMTKDCEYLKKIMIPNYLVSEEEVNFPIAYSILLHEKVVEVIRLLSAIYRPQNVYCIHVDRYASIKTHAAVTGVTSCLKNMFLASKLENVIYGGFTRLQAEVNCMDDMLKHRVHWRYFINLTSRMFPLKTNAEIVKILKIYNGANDIEGITERRRMLPQRLKHKIKYVKQSGRKKLQIQKTSDALDVVPHNIKLVKGSAYGIFSREFVKFALQDKKAKDLLEWCKQLESPDEYYWATLNHNPSLHPPGGYSGKPDLKPWLAAFASWIGYDPCKGKNVHGVCIFGVGDIHRLVSRKELFANKFYIDFQYLALDCLEEWLYNRTLNPLPFDSLYYKSLPFVHKT